MQYTMHQRAEPTNSTFFKKITTIHLNALGKIRSTSPSPAVSLRANNYIYIYKHFSKIYQILHSDATLINLENQNPQYYTSVYLKLPDEKAKISHAETYSNNDSKYTYE